MEEDEPLVLSRRRLVVLAVDGYTDEKPAFAKGIKEQAAFVTGWLTDPALEERAFEVSAPDKLESLADVREFLSGQALAEADDDDALVLYITGHGVAGRSNRHYLLLPGSDNEHLLGTAFPTSEVIAAVLDSAAAHVLVLVDSCFSGTLQAELNTLLLDLPAWRRNIPGTAVVTSGHFEDRPKVGEFCELLALALDYVKDEASGYAAEHLSFAEWEEILQRVGDRRPELIAAQWIRPSSRRREASACLPNPAYRPAEHLVAPALRQLAVPTRPLEEYWLSRASGRPREEDPGWYFRGRTELMRALVGFLTGPPEVMEVTGTAGSGKSALLAQIVTLTDPGFLTDPRFAEAVGNLPDDVLPEQGTVDAAMLARNKSSRTMVEELLATIAPDRPEADSVPVQTLLDAIQDHTRATGRPMTLVIDGLDEAEEPQALIGDIILPIARLHDDDHEPLVRLLLGIRSTTGSASNAQPQNAQEELLTFLNHALESEHRYPVVVRTDGPDCEADITTYTEALLLTDTDSPYHGDTHAARQAAVTIARSVTPSFLDARLAADRLRTAPTRQDLQDTVWHEQLSAGTVALLRADLEDVAAHTAFAPEVLLAVLRATAFAPGAGLPWADVWPAAARGLLDRHPDVDRTEAAVRTVRSTRLVGYLTSAEEDSRTVYRPVHQRITEQLRHGHHWLLGTEPDDRDRIVGAKGMTMYAHSQIAGAFAELINETEYPLHPYLLRHHVQHAASGGVLEDLFVPARLLRQEKSLSLRAQLGLPLPVADVYRRTVTAAALIEPYLDATTDEASRQSSIAFHRTSMIPVDEQEDDRLAAPVQTQWSQWRARTNVLASPRHKVKVMVGLATNDGRGLMAGGSAWGVEVWDASSGQRTAALNIGPTRALCPIRATGGREFLLTAGDSGLGIWDPLSGQLIHGIPLPLAHEAHVLADGDDRWKVIGVGDRSVHLWYPEGNYIHEVPEISGRLVSGSSDRTAVVRDARGKPWLAAIIDQGLRVWDPEDLTAPALPSNGPQPKAITVIPRLGRADLVLIRPHGAKGSDAWDVFDDVFVYPLTNRRHFAAAPLPDEAVVTASGGTIDIRGTESGHARFFVSDRFLDALATVRTADGWMIATAGAEGIRLWPPHDRTDQAFEWRGATAASLEQHPLQRNMWPMAVAGRGDLLVLGAANGLQVRDTTSGSWRDTIAPGPVVDLCVLPDQFTNRVAATTIRGLVIHDLDIGSIEHVPDTGDARLVCAVPRPGKPDLVLSDRRSIWNLEEGRERSFAHGHRISFLTALPQYGGRYRPPVVAAATERGIDIWDIARGEQVGRLRVRGSQPGVSVLCAFTMDGGDYLAATDRTGIHIWNLAIAELHSTIPTPHPMTLTAVSTPEGRTVLASGDGSSVRLWDPMSGNLIQTVITSAPVRALTAHDKGRLPALFIAGPAGVAALGLEGGLPDSPGPRTG
ncbi:AAA family ATPase [Kitasatospora sp. NPDC056731]|uniref:AAA family ATPase n=1 Tax=Kitasatospora sp. NPDC056731 TaxID=3155422 RepID=UPI00342FADD5